MIGADVIGSSLVVTQGYTLLWVDGKAVCKSYGTGVGIGADESIWVEFIWLPE